MIVTCPNCSTKFNLPDANATPGAKLRCSVCKHVFPLPETAEKQELSLTPKESGIDIDNLPVPEAKKRKNSSGSLIVLLLLLCAVAGGTWYAWTHTALLDGIKSIIVPEKPQERMIWFRSSPFAACASTTSATKSWATFPSLRARP